jgi:hypothetical protein
MTKRPQIGGSHYQGFAIEPIDFIMGNNLPFAEGSVIKYICRWRLKNGREDLLKARQYIDFLLEKEAPPAPDIRGTSADPFVTVAGVQVPASDLE